MKKNLFYLSFFFVVISCPSAEQYVGGIINEDVRWSAEKGPYIIETDLIIPMYKHLTIGPGTKVIIASYPDKDSSDDQIDDFDKSSVSIKVRGLLSCLGTRSERVVFSSEKKPSGEHYGWYGIIFDHPEKEDGGEIICTDITGAYIGVNAISCSPTIRGCVIENNHIGIFCQKPGNVSITNSFIGYNLLAGVRISDANPEIIACIILGNKNNGIWGDGTSKITLNNNCFWKNEDGNFLDCDPDFGILVKKNKRGDSIDIGANIFSSPVFAGSPDDSIATERDLNTPTDSSKVKNTLIADIIQSFQKKPQNTRSDAPVERISLSKYSPCIDAGYPDSKYKDLDGSLNDIGIYGGPEFIVKSKQSIVSDVVSKKGKPAKSEKKAEKKEKKEKPKKSGH
jgi:hypothetical protein